MRRILVAPSALVLALGAAAPAARAERLPQELPPAASTRAAGPAALPGAAAPEGRWLLGVRGAQGAALARRAGARAVVPGAVAVPTRDARALADRLRHRGLLTWSQPDRALRRQSSFDGRTGDYARAVVVPPDLAVPAPGPSIAVVDDRVDDATPDVGPSVRHLNERPLAGAHGTEVASVAAGLANGSGVTGIFPGAPLLSWATDLSCADVARGIEAARAAGARVINLSLGGPGECLPVTIAVQRAFAGGAVVVAASGNEFAAGNPVIYPAASPHVLSVAAVDQQGRPTEFSTANAAVDLAAPGVAIPVATPLALDDDGARDGVGLADGTSFSAPMVSGAVAWLRAVRPGLGAGQYADLARAGAVDVAKAGYDVDTGYGVVNLPRSLAAPTPRADPREPNDGITYVNGVVLGRTATPVYTGARGRRFVATIDVVEDPVDVYRIRIPARRAVAVRVRQRSGDSDLGVFSSSARTINGRALAISRRRGSATDSLRVRNPGRRTVTRYVAIVPGRRTASLNETYELELARARLR